MGKSVGLVGSIVNKIGNFVFSTWHGMQIIKAYQPNISNPRSAAQVAQRDRFDYAIQYSIAANKLPYLKHLWDMITPQFRTPFNQFTSLNLLKADYEVDNTLCPNKMIINANNDYLQHIILSGAQSCAVDIWYNPGLDVSGCGDEPDGFLIIQVFNANLLADPNQSPFLDAKMCDEYIFNDHWPIVADTPVVSEYKLFYDLCCPECADPAGECCDACVWIIPVFSGGVDASSDPLLITKAAEAVLLCTPA